MARRRLVVLRFLSQPSPLPETVFLHSLGEFFPMAEGENWLLNTMVFALYFIKASPWFWPMLTRGQQP